MTLKHAVGLRKHNFMQYIHVSSKERNIHVVMCNEQIFYKTVNFDYDTTIFILMNIFYIHLFTLIRLID